MLPTSLPGGRPSGITAARPTSACAAIAARCGIAAASSGVRPSSSSLGSSAQPSGTRTTYFTARDGTRPGPFYPPDVAPRLLALVALASLFLTVVPAGAASNPPPLALKRIAAVGGATAMATRDG